MTKRRTVLLIRQLRREREWTLADAAKKAGYSPGAMSHIERGFRRPSFDKARALSALYGLPIEELFREVKVPA